MKLGDGPKIFEFNIKDKVLYYNYGKKKDCYCIFEIENQGKSFFDDINLCKLKENSNQLFSLNLSNFKLYLFYNFSVHDIKEIPIIILRISNFFKKQNLISNIHFLKGKKLESEFFYFIKSFQKKKFQLQIEPQKKAFYLLDTDALKEFFFFKIKINHFGSIIDYLQDISDYLQASKISGYLFFDLHLKIKGSISFLIISEAIDVFEKFWNFLISLTHAANFHKLLFSKNDFKSLIKKKQLSLSIPIKNMEIYNKLLKEICNFKDLNKEIKVDEKKKSNDQVYSNFEYVSLDKSIFMKTESKDSVKVYRNEKSIIILILKMNYNLIYKLLNEYYTEAKEIILSFENFSDLQNIIKNTRIGGLKKIKTILSSNIPQIFNKLE